MNAFEIVAKIKSKQWDVRVSRTGFLQSKSICIQAEVLPISLTKNIVVQFHDECWVGDLNLYDEKACNSFKPFFGKAFEENPLWPLDIMKVFDSITERKELLVKQLNSPHWDLRPKETKALLLPKYVSLLHSIQKYYAIAVTFASFCEETIIDNKFEELLKTHAISYQKLDLDLFYKSINSLKSIKDSKKLAEEKQKHLDRFAWIKNSYNSIEPYTLEELNLELASKKPKKVVKKTKTAPIKVQCYVTGLQVAIFMRNRMKELSQQLWQAFEPLGQSIAKDFSLTREDFYQLRVPEIIESISQEKCIIPLEEIKSRQKGFINCMLDGEEVLLTGSIVKELESYYSPKVEKGITQVKGTVACKGKVNGTAQIILKPADLKHFKEGNILITAMTTPDFVVVMKKAIAVVTDEGGLTSHAAIVSRELNIPCVIGTKTATKVFQNEDKIEVDAINGIVKKI